MVRVTAICATMDIYQLSLHILGKPCNYMVDSTDSADFNADEVTINSRTAVKFSGYIICLIYVPGSNGRRITNYEEFFDSGCDEKAETPSDT